MLQILNVETLLQQPQSQIVVFYVTYSQRRKRCMHRFSIKAFCFWRVLLGREKNRVLVCGQERKKLLSIIVISLLLTYFSHNGMILSTLIQTQFIIALLLILLKIPHSNRIIDICITMDLSFLRQYQTLFALLTILHVNNYIYPQISIHLSTLDQ